MIEIVETREFSRWFDGLRDLWAQANIQARIDRSVVVVLLAGGDKSTQDPDIATALRLLREMKKENKK